MQYEKRLKRFQAWLAEQGDQYDAVLISDRSNIRYLSGFTGTFAYLDHQRRQSVHSHGFALHDAGASAVSAFHAGKACALHAADEHCQALRARELGGAGV